MCEYQCRRSIQDKSWIRCSYQNSDPYGNTASGSNRAALQEKLNAPIDVSREAVTTQTVLPPSARKSFRVSLFGKCVESGSKSVRNLKFIGKRTYGCDLSSQLSTS